jgi:hypothetical protein
MEAKKILPLFFIYFTHNHMGFLPRTWKIHKIFYKLVSMNKNSIPCMSIDLMYMPLLRHYYQWGSNMFSHQSYYIEVQCHNNMNSYRLFHYGHMSRHQYLYWSICKKMKVHYLDFIESNEYRF